MWIEADLKSGRPTGAVKGNDQRVVMAFSGQVVSPTPSGYRSLAQLGNEEPKFTSFTVNHRPVQPTLLRSG